MGQKIQFALTPAAAKRLIARALVTDPRIVEALKNQTIVVIAGTTNGYVAEELLKSIGQAEGFTRNRFFRGLTLPRTQPTTVTGRLPDESAFPGEVIIRNGEWIKGRTVFDVVDDLTEGDIVIKGANALEMPRKKAGIYIGDPKAGTIGSALQAVCGRRVRLMVPVGLEKRIYSNLDEIAATINAPGAKGPRMLTVSAEVFTEIDAVAGLSGAKATLVAGGGVGGAEGSIWLLVEGTEAQVDALKEVLREVTNEPAFTL
jgi:hypothetical protein